jgi:hypothetical protein
MPGIQNLAAPLTPLCGTPVGNHCSRSSKQNAKKVRRKVAEQTKITGKSILKNFFDCLAFLTPNFYPFIVHYILNDFN